MRRRRRFFAHWENRLGLALVFMFLIGAVFAPVISPQDEKNPGAFKQVGRVTDLYPHPPSEKAILGTLPAQYDIFHTLIWGTRDALKFGLLVAVGSFLIGTILGSVAGYAGGFVNSLIMRIADAFLTFPPLAGVVFLQQLVAISIVGLGGTFYFNIGIHGKVIHFNEEPTPLMQFLSRVDPVMISLILFSWVPYTRLVNSIVLTLKQTDFVQAARALGGSPLWIIWRHIVPNSVGPALVLGARDVGGAVILQATITFIGLGGVSPWGTLLSMGRKFVLGPGGSLFTHWWVYLPATLAVILFGVSWNLIGDGLNDALTPKSNSEFASLPASSKREKDQPASQKQTGAPVPSTLPGANASSVQKVPEAASSVIRSPLNPGVDPVLVEARRNMADRDLSRALHAYGHLVWRNRCISDALPDLAQLVKQFPRDPRVWQTLGDALARAGDSDHAAKSYEQAQKLRHDI